MPWDHELRDGCDCCEADGVGSYVSPLFLGVVVWSICHLNLLSLNMRVSQETVNG